MSGGHEWRPGQILDGPGEKPDDQANIYGSQYMRKLRTLECGRAQFGMASITRHAAFVVRAGRG